MVIKATTKPFRRRAGQVASYLKEDLRQGTRIVEYAYGSALIVGCGQQGSRVAIDEL
ncbi:hypothetical protein OK016_24280 [Vibrio chagasii]|nr:hypothetical protein [Vibrio chagasii]